MSRMAELESKVQALTEKVDAHVMAYGFDRKHFYEMHTSSRATMRDLEAKMTGMEATMTAKMTAAEAKMTAAAAKMTAAEAQIEALGGRVGELERPWYQARAKKKGGGGGLGVLLGELARVGEVSEAGEAGEVRASSSRHVATG